jgi:hypothetical protein
MKDDIKPEEIKNDDAESSKKDTPVHDDDLLERDIDKELERVESIEGGKEDLDSSESIDETESSVEPIAETPIESVAPKPTIDEIMSKNIDRPVKNKKPVGWIIVSIILLLALAGAIGYYFYDKMNQDQTVANLRTQINDSDQQKQAAINQLASLKASQAKAENEAKAQDDIKYREISEFGIRYKLTETTKDQTYAVFPKSTDQISIAFSTLALSGLIEKSKSGDTDEYPCALNISGPQTISYYKDGATMIGSDAGGKSPVSKVGKKVGDGYFYFVAAQSACSTKLADQQAANLKAVEEIYKSLEAIPAE